MHVRRGYRIKVVDAEQEVTIGRLKTVAEGHSCGTSVSSTAGK